MENNRMLVVSAHAADWCTRAGGTIAKYVRDGFEVTVICLTYGEHGESAQYWRDHPGCSFADVKKNRREEAQDAADFLGVSHIEFLDYADYPLVIDEERQRYLTRRVLDIRPRIVLTHWLDDLTNADHELTGRATVKAVTAASMLGAIPGVAAHFIPDLFMFESTVTMSEFNAFKINTYIDIGDTVEIKYEAISRFKAQPQLAGFYDQCALTRGMQANDWERSLGLGITHAEGFVRYTPFIGDLFPLSKRD